MSLIASAKQTGGFEPLEPGSYAAVCYGLIDYGDQYSERWNKWQSKIRIMWEIPGEKITIDGEERSRVVSKEYTNSLSDKANLRSDLQSWRGREFTQEELAAFDLRNIVGVPCMLSIIHTTGKDGRTYIEVNGVMKLPKGFTIEKPTLEHVVFDVDTSPLEMVEQFPDWIQSKIKSSRNYNERLKDNGAAENQFYNNEDEVPF